MKKTFIKKGRRELWDHKLQYFLLIVILGLGVAMFNSMYDFLDAREIMVEKIYSKSNFMDVEVTYQYGLTLSLEESEDIIMGSNFRSEISSVEYRLKNEVYINHTVDKQDKLTKGLVYGYEYFTVDDKKRDITVNNPLFFDEEITFFKEPIDHSCFLEVGFAEYYDISSGDIISVVMGDNKIDLTVSEIINVPDYFMVVTSDSLFPVPDNLGVMITTLETANELLYGENTDSRQVNNVIIRLSDDVDLSDVKEDFEKTFEKNGLAVEVIKGENNPARSQIESDLEGDREIIGIFPIVIFFISGIGLIITFRRMIKSHKPQIGVFKALGIPNLTILSYFVIIGVIVSVLGIFIGYLMSIPLSMMFNSLMDEFMRLAVSVSSSSYEYYVLSGLISFAICISCTLLPSFSAVRMKPVEVIQKREGLRAAKKQKKYGLKSLSKKLPKPFLLVYRELTRRPARPFTTIIGVALALALFLSVVIMMDSMFLFLDKTKDINSWDYEISMTGFSPVSVSDNWLVEKEYIDSVNSGLRLPINLSKNDVEMEGFLNSVSDIQSTFNLGVEYYSGEGLYVSRIISDKLDVEKGDWVEVKIPRVGNDNSFSIVEVDLEILGIHDNPMGVYVYSNVLTVEKITNLHDIANVFYINTFDGKLPRDIENRIVTTQGVSSFVYVEDRGSMIDDMFELLIGFIFAMIMMSMLLALAIVYNLFIIGANENKRVYATMKTLGTSIKRISYLILIEGAVTLVGGIVLGSIWGYFMAVGMFNATDVFEYLTIDIVFSWSGFILGVIANTIVVLFVSYLTIRYINKINIADVIRERATG